MPLKALSDEASPGPRSSRSLEAVVAGRQRHWAGGSGAEQSLCLMEQKGQGLNPGLWDGRSCPSQSPGLSLEAAWAVMGSAQEGQQCNGAQRPQGCQDTAPVPRGQPVSSQTLLVQTTAMAKGTKSSGTCRQLQSSWGRSLWEGKDGESSFLISLILSQASAQPCLLFHHRPGFGFPCPRHGLSEPW